MERGSQTRVIAAAVFIFVVTSLWVTGVATARYAFIVWVDGLVQRVEPTYRDLSILDYKTGSVT